MISTAVNLTPSIWNTLIPFWQTIRIFFLLQSMWKVLYVVKIECREGRKLLTNGQHQFYFLVEAIPQCLYIKFYHHANITLSVLMDFIIAWIPQWTVIYPRHWSCLPAPPYAMLSWSRKRTKVFIRKLPSQSWKWTYVIARTTSITRMTLVRTHPAALQRVASC